jgi:hypothetical protein
MTQEALKLALEKIATVYAMDYEYQAWAREALAQTQEPWCMKMNGCKTKCEDCPDCVPPSPQRTWVGLTEQQRNDIENACEMIIGKPAFDAIEAKLKELNT